MNLELASHYRARSDRGSSGKVLSTLATLIAPLFAVLLSHYVNSQEKHQTTFALPVQYTDVGSQQVQFPEARPELSMGNESPEEHIHMRQEYPLKSEKQTPAKKLLDRANETKDNPASQYVMLQLAKDIAIQANDEQTAFQAIDRMAETFHVDANTMKMAVLSKFASAAHKPAQHKSIADEALKLADQAVSQDHFMVANQLDKLALAEAKRASDMELLAQAQAQIAVVTELVKAREHISK
jgi:hypothetical protein